MNKDNKYYSLVEQLVRQNKKIIGNEQFVDDIINDVLSHADTIIQTIDNENIIKEFLNKAVTTSIITVSKRMNKKTLPPTGAQQLIEKLNNKQQNININKKYVDNFINGKTDNIQENEIIENNIETDEKQITYEQLSEITVQDELDAKYDTVGTSIDFNNSNDESVDSDTIADNTEEKILLEESFKILNNNNNDITDYSADIDTYQDIDTTTDNIEQQNDILNSEVSLSDSTDTQEIGSLELTFNETEDNEINETNSISNTEIYDTTFDNDSNDTEGLSGINDEYSNIETSIESDNASLTLEELDSENILEPEMLQIETDEYDSEVKDDFDNEESIANILDNKTPGSIYEILSYNQKSTNVYSDNINAEKIMENLKSLDTEYPELNILDICRLRYHESNKIDNISSALNMDKNDVIKALNLMMNVV